MPEGVADGDFDGVHSFGGFDGAQASAGVEDGGGIAFVGGFDFDGGEAEGEFDFAGVLVGDGGVALLMDPGEGDFVVEVTLIDEKGFGEEPGAEEGAVVEEAEGAVFVGGVGGLGGVSQKERRAEVVHLGQVLVGGLAG